MALAATVKFHIIVTRFRFLRYTSWFTRFHPGYAIGMVMDMYNENNCKIDVIGNVYITKSHPRPCPSRKIIYKMKKTRKQYSFRNYKDKELRFMYKEIYAAVLIKYNIRKCLEFAYLVNYLQKEKYIFLRVI